MVEFIMWSLLLVIIGSALLGAFGFVIQAWALGLTAFGLILLSLGG